MSPLAPSLLETSEDLFDKVIAVNLKGPFRLTALFARGWRRAMAARSSTCRHRLDSAGCAYRSVFGGEGRTQRAHRRAGAGVRAQGARQLHHSRAVSHRHQQGMVQRRVPREGERGFSLERGGEPEECVGAALYFAGPASSFTTGATLVIDGNSSNPWTRGSIKSEERVLSSGFFSVGGCLKGPSQQSRIQRRCPSRSQHAAFHAIGASNAWQSAPGHLRQSYGGKGKSRKTEGRKIYPRTRSRLKMARSSAVIFSRMREPLPKWR